MSINSQIENRNFLSPTGFKFTLNRSPKVAFFCNQANIPDLSLSVATYPTRLGRDVPEPGNKIDFGDLNLTFLIDENLENYMEIQNWMRGLGYPEDLNELYNLQKEYFAKERESAKMMNIYSDATLFIQNSARIPTIQIRFKDLFPYSLSTLSFDATQTDTEYFTAEVSFKYTIYSITDMSGNLL
jgi:hypothetical protein